MFGQPSNKTSPREGYGRCPTRYSGCQPMRVGLMVSSHGTTQMDPIWLRRVRTVPSEYSTPRPVYLKVSRWPGTMAISTGSYTGRTLTALDLSRLEPMHKSLYGMLTTVASSRVSTPGLSASDLWTYGSTE